MADAAFNTDWKYVSDHLFGQGANALVSGSTGRLAALSNSVLEEAKRIYRLCLHKKVTISSNPQHERCFCIFCALSVKQPNVWATVVQRMAERRMSTCRIPHAGEFNVNEVKRFIRVAFTALNLEIAAAGTEALPSVGSNKSKRKDAGDVVISASHASSIVRDTITSTVEKKSGAVKVAPATTSKRPTVEQDSDAEEEAFSSYGSSKIIRTRDWVDITRRVSELQSRFPSWHQTALASAEAETVLGPVLFAAPTSVSSNADGSCSSCSACGRELQPSTKGASSDDTTHTLAQQQSRDEPIVYQCVECNNYVHHTCVWPNQQDIPAPFTCHLCRLEGGRKRREDSGDSFLKVGAEFQVVRLHGDSQGK